MTAGNLTSEGPSAVIDQECKGEYMDRIIIFDTTLRDGEQAPGFSMNVEEKLKLCDEVEFSAEDAGRTEINYLCTIFDAVIEAGATIVNVPDTVGYQTPAEYGQLIRTLRERLKNADRVTISTHCHDDLGLAVANSLAAIENGARQVECAINGIGERAGNAALEEIVMALDTRKRYYNVTTGVKTQELYRSSQLLCQLTGKQVQVNKAIVGENAFAHEAGIHQDGMLKNAVTYEIMSPDHVGVPRSMIVLGKHSGRHALEARYRELGYSLTREQLERRYVKFLEVADRKKRVEDQDLISIHESAHSVAAG